MNYKNFFFLLSAILLTTCAGQKKTIIFHPDPKQDKLQEQTDSSEVWELIASQNGSSKTGIPAWVRLYLEGEVRQIESMDIYKDKYIFIGENRGDNFHVLQQWADNFAIEYDFPGLIAKRAERRLINSATLYPDDEYGEYFAALIKKISDSEYSEVTKEQTFWIKKKVTVIAREDDELSETDTEFERYEFLVLISANREALEKKMREIMTGIKTKTAPTKEQAASINKIKRTFFEDF
jgi:hypothetical protein